jgi:hypothetical protein
VKEPQREEDAAGQPRAVEQENSHPQELAIAPKAYAFDGWGMVPLAFDPV